MPIEEILVDNTRVEGRAGAFAAISLRLSRILGGTVDIDFGSVHKDVISGEKRVTTGFTLGIDLFGFGLEGRIGHRDVEFEDFPPGCLYCLPSESGFDFAWPWESDLNEGRRRRGTGGEIGFGIGGSAEHDIIGDVADILDRFGQVSGPRGGGGGGGWE